MRKLLFIALWTFSCLLQAADVPLHEVNGIEHFPQDPALRKMLSKNGFAVVPREHRQIYTPYLKLNYKLPPFVTVDSALRTYQVLFQQALEVIEIHQAERLADISRQLLAHLRTITVPDDPLWRDAKDRLCAWAAVGLRLQKENAGFELLSLSARELAQSEWKKIRSEAPSFSVIFPRERRFLYNLLAPATFYAKKPVLQRFFRACKWYGVTGFRINSEKEKRAAYILALALHREKNLLKKIHRFGNLYERCLGPADDVTLAQSAALFTKVHRKDTAFFSDTSLSAFCGQINALPQPEINDQWLPLDVYCENFEGATHGPRLLPPRYTWEAHLGTRLASPHQIYMELLDLTMSMGDKRAETILKQRWPKKDTDFVKKNGLDCLRHAPPSLYTDYTKLLKCLYEPVPESAPRFAHTPAWKTKCTWTGLAGWTCMRHLWQLHAKELFEIYGGFPLLPSGYVSPYPEVFKKLSHLALKTQTVLKENGITSTELDSSEDTGNTITADDIQKVFRSFAQLMQTLTSISQKQIENKPLTRKEHEVLFDYGDTIGRLCSFFSDTYYDPLDDMPLVHLFKLFGAGTEMIAHYAAVGRAFEIYVIRKTIETGHEPARLQLYKGAVLSLYEFQKPFVENRLTNEAWKDLLDSKDRPPVPSWSSDFLQPIQTAAIDRLRAGEAVPFEKVKGHPELAEAALAGYFALRSRGNDKGDIHWEYFCKSVTAQDAATLPALAPRINEPSHLSMLARTFQKKAPEKVKQKLLACASTGHPNLLVMAYYAVDPSTPVEKLRTIFGTSGMGMWALAATLGFPQSGEDTEKTAQLQHLIQLAEGNSGYLARAQAMAGLYKGEKETVLPVLRKGLSDPSPAVRTFAALSLLELGDLVSIPLMVQALWYLRDPVTRARTVKEGERLRACQTYTLGFAFPPHYPKKPMSFLESILFDTISGFDTTVLTPFKALNFNKNPLDFDVWEESEFFRALFVTILKDKTRPPAHKLAAFDALSYQKHDEDLIDELTPLLEDTTTLPDGITVASHAKEHIKEAKKNAGIFEFLPEDDDNEYDPPEGDNNGGPLDF